MLIVRSDQVVSQRHPPTTASHVDSSVRDTYLGLLGLPVPERFIELVQSYPDQQAADSGNRNCGSHAPLLHRCSE
jgi:hypothetical protein